MKKILKKYQFVQPTNKAFKFTFFRVADQLKLLIVRAIPEVNVEHVGSTSIGIAGKNIIDILVICKSKLRYSKVIDGLSKLGFHESIYYNPPKERPMLVGMFLYKKKKYSVHLHLTYKNSKVCKDAVFFRDYLKKNIKKAKEYELIKKNAFLNGKKNVSEYNAYKDNFIKSIVYLRK